jgi:alanine dehydrogenase
VGSSFVDDEYTAAGATIETTHEAVFAKAAMIVKVKEPTAAEFKLLRPDQILFTYLHLANDEPLTRVLIERRVPAIAYETVQLANGPLPLLQPMSEVAGRMSVQVGAHLLEKTQGGRGVLLGGVPGVPEASVVIIGGGIVGTNAAQMALGLGANVTILDMNIDRLRYLDQILHGRIHTLGSNAHTIADALTTADLVIGSVLVPGKRAPKLVTADMVQHMRPGSVMVDVAIDQGGCFQTSKPTTHSDSTYLVNDVIHYCVTNMPGAVPRTSTLALANVTLPYALALADQGFFDAVTRDPALAKGVNVLDGRVTHPGVAEAFGIDYSPLETVLANIAA